MNSNCNNEIAAAGASCNYNRKNKAVDEAVKYSNCANPSRSHSNRRLIKKSVRFDTKVNLYRLGTSASDMPSKYKQRVWYTPCEYDQLKYDAANSAGVKIIQYGNRKTNPNHRCAMMGDFDCKDTKEDVISTSTKNSNINVDTSITPRENATKKFYYNENEYNDSLNDGKEVCKRGLGFHFSRDRRKTRIKTRSAVVTWQKMLRAYRYNQHGLKLPHDMQTVGTNAGGFDKSHLMLALISAKFSHTAREEARWRGDVDYRVAYPSRHESLVMPSSYCQNEKSNAANGNERKEDVQRCGENFPHGK